MQVPLGSKFLREGGEQMEQVPVIGIDLAVTAASELAVAAGATIEASRKVASTPRGLTEGIRQAAKGRAVAIVVESTAMAWFIAAVAAVRSGVEYRLYRVSGRKSAALRAFYRSHTKTDHIDARVLARMPAVDDSLLTYSLPAPSELAMKRQLRRGRQAVGEQRVVHGGHAGQHPGIDVVGLGVGAVEGPQRSGLAPRHTVQAVLHPRAHRCHRSDEPRHGGGLHHDRHGPPPGCLADPLGQAPGRRGDLAAGLDRCPRRDGQLACGGDGEIDADDWYVFHLFSSFPQELASQRHLRWSWSPDD